MHPSVVQPNPRMQPTNAAELHVLRTMLLWATRVREADGSWLLRDYPLRGLKLPREEDVRRPIANHDRFLIRSSCPETVIYRASVPASLPPNAPVCPEKL
jgi:hypothetical protein